MWSVDNRTAGFRLCGAGTKAMRVECRVGGADLNPYLAFAALIAAGLDGIDAQMELEAPFVGDAYERHDARNSARPCAKRRRRCDDSEMLRAAMGEDVIDHYVHAAEWEQAEYDRRMTDWELRRGFERA